MSRLRKTPIRWLLIVAGLLLLISPVASQDGTGAIIEGNLREVTGLGSLNPLRCNNPGCQRITDFLFPRLVGVDPATGTYAETSTGDNVLALSWNASPDGESYTFVLRDDLLWSDGVPVTAYDVFYSYLAIASDDIDSPYTARVHGAISGAVPVDANTIAFIFKRPTCNAPSYTDFPIIPAHIFEPEFADTAAAAFDGGEDLLAQFERWTERQSERDFEWMNDTVFDDEPPATAGIFQIDVFQPTDYIRLITADGAQGFAYVDVPDNQTLVQRFLTGEVNFIENPPYEYWQDIRAIDDAQVFEYPGNTWDYINFNLADPENPQSAFDEDGNPLDQGQHPIFGDVRVRRAIQMAIDVEALIDITVLGNGTAIPANQLPTSWAFNPDLQPVAYDPIGAMFLLEEAGWKDTNNNGVRECITCLTAEEGTSMVFALLYAETGEPRRPLMASLIEAQLDRVGFNVFTRGVDPGALMNLMRRQEYDAYLAGWTESYPVNPDQTHLFTSAGDVLEEGFNTGSYYNETVEELMVQARNLPDCDHEAHAELYRQMQVILQEDQPYVWLFAPNTLVAARGSVIGFDPYPNAPFWNVRDWLIFD